MPPSLTVLRRAATGDTINREHQQHTSLLLGIVAAAVVVVLLVIVFIIHAIRTKAPPKWLPKALRSRWVKHQIHSKTTYQRASSGNNNDVEFPNSHNPIVNPRVSALANRGLDRHTSVRSIMTLPEYRPLPKPGVETTIAREGERDGIDVVVDFPETEEEMEERREEHMEALYRVRQARAAVLERQRAASNPNTTSSSSTTTTTVPATAFLETNVVPTASAANLAALLKERNRRISSVAYADLGHARHDGSRISMSSDREGLLSSAASIGGASSRYHIRSGSSMSIATSLAPTPERRRSEDFFMPPRLNLEIPGAEGSPVVNRPSMDLGEQPPNYDGRDWEALSPPPQYESPVVARRNLEIEIPELRVIASTPSIAPTSAGVAPSPMTPLGQAPGLGAQPARRGSRLSISS